MDEVLLEYKERVRIMLCRLMEESKDPYYDQYLAQMLRDLDSGKATPAQVEQEAQRSYNQYRQRMMQQEMAKIHELHRQQEMAKPEAKKKGSMEFKVGAHVFSFLGAVFILAAFVILGFNFMNGLAQGLCLYGVAIILVILSELLLSRKLPAFSTVLTGIGIGGLYAANIVNYLVLHTINGMITLAVALLIAVGAFLISKKKESAAMRIISLLGCYISFFPVKGFETEFRFLIAAVLLFIINISGVFIQNQKWQMTIDSVHVFLNMFFTTLIIGIARIEELNPAYLVLFVMTSFIFNSILCLRRSAEKENIIFVFGCVANGICILFLFLIGNTSPGAYDPGMVLFVHLLTEIFMAAVCGVIFLLWDKEDGRRWGQVYFVVGTVLALSTFTEYHLERTIAVLAVFFIVKLLADRKEIRVLDCIVVVWTGLLGVWFSDDWYCWLFAAALLLSALKIKSMYIFHELVITFSILAICWNQCGYYLNREFNFDRGWLYPAGAGMLLLLFLVFNHLPGLKDKDQKPYNIVNIILMALYYFSVWRCDNYIFNSIMMVLGTVTIIVIFRKRYELNIPGKQLFLAGFLVYFALTGHFKSPVIVSILLMIIALGCVGGGFKAGDKVERICGLVLAFIVCIKLVTFDFREVEILYRMIVFFVVGAIALIISFIYVQLEKNIERQEIQK